MSVHKRKRPKVEGRDLKRLEDKIKNNNESMKITLSSTYGKLLDQEKFYITGVDLSKGNDYTVNIPYLDKLLRNED